MSTHVVVVYIQIDSGTFFQISRGADIESSSKSLRFAFVDSPKTFAAQNTRSERLVGSDLDGSLLTDREM